MTIRFRLLAVFGLLALTMISLAVLLAVYGSLAAAVIAGAVSVGLTVGVAFFTIRAITRPMTSLILQTYAFGEENLDPNVEYKGSSELAILSAEYHRLTDRLETDGAEITRLKAEATECRVALDRERALMEERITKRSRDLQVQSEMAAKDELTGLPNRREAIARLELLWGKEKLYGDRLACIIIDIDHFKSVNDTYGHGVGDIVLKETARLLRENVRATDTVCRVGGEEFLVICSQGRANGAAACAEHLRIAVQNHTVSIEDRSLNVTVSLGVAERGEEMEDYEALLEKADECLYAAKGAGRNRIVVADQDGPNAMTRLPRQNQTPVRARITAKERAPTDPIRVLISHGQARFRRRCCEILDSKDFDVIEAPADPDPLAVLQQIMPEVIIVGAARGDSEWPARIRQSGVEQAIRAIPVVMIGDDDQKQEVVDGAEGCIDEFMTAPLRPEQFILRLKSLARLYRGKLDLIRSNQLHQEQKRVMSLLFDFSRSLASAFTLAAVIQKTLSVTAELTGCRRLSILLPDQKKTTLTVADALGADDSSVAAIRVPVGAGTTGRVFQSGKSVVINCANEAHRVENEQDAPLFGSVPLASCPLGVAASVVGILNLSDRDGGCPFTETELEHVSHICNMSASAIADNMSRKLRDQARDSIVEALGKLAEYRDDDTGRHLERVTQFSVLLAEELRCTDAHRNEIDEQFLHDLRRSVPLHDIGKVGIPDSILLQPHRLSGEEMTIMKTHVGIGVEVIRSVRERVPGAGYLKMAEHIAGGHHEWHDGTGYPKGVKGEDIPLSARIVALADVYDALTTKRPYKPAFSHAEAAAIICKSDGAQFDPAVAAAFQKRRDQFASMANELFDGHPESDREDPPPEPTAKVRRKDDNDAECYTLAPLK